MESRPCDGVSLLPLIEDNMNERPRPIAFESAGCVSLIDNRYKIIHNSGGYELYDLVEDAGEQHDIAADHPDIVKKMQAALDTWRDSCKNSLKGGDY
jgi:arylsulfatase A-like enzyme